MDKLFQDFSLKHISEQTHISFLALKKLKLRNFNGFNKVKLKGFIKILKKEYPNYNFSSLEDDINNYFEDKSELFEPPKEEKSNKIYIVVFLLIVLIISLLFVLNKKTNHNSSIKEVNQTQIIPKIEINITKKLHINEINKSIKVEIKPEINNTKKEINNTLAIIPIYKVWMRVTYLDNFKSKQYLTKNEIDLNGSRNIFILLGHGYETFQYKDYNLTPYTKKVTRVVLIDGNLSITNKKLKEFR